MKISLLVILILGFIKHSLSQVTAGDCDSAVNICTNANFLIAPNGFGSINEIPPSGSLGNPNSISPPLSNGLGCLLAGELNSTWMIINIQTAGILEFSFGAGTVNPQAGCYDWIMYPYTASTCTQIAADLLAPTRCNWNTTCNGGTGIANTIPSGASSPNFAPGLAVNCGDQYIVCFSNYSSVNTSVSLNFFGSAQVSCNPIPMPLPLTVSNQTICQGSTVSLIVTGSATNSYTWQPGNLNSNTISVSPTVTTTYSVIGGGICSNMTSSATAIVTVDQAAANFTIINSGLGGSSDPTPAEQCLSGNLFDFNTSVVGATHAWYFGAAATPSISSLANPSNISFNSPGIYNITHTVTGTSCASVITQTVKVDPMPLATLTITNPSCSQNNGAIQISTITSIGQTMVSFSVNTIPFTSQTINALSAGLYTITLLNNFGCVSSLTTSLINTPNITSMVLTANSASCSGNSGSITIGNISGGTLPFQYNINGGSYGSNNFFTNLTAGIYTLGVIDVNNCTHTETISVISISVPTGITFTTLPTACAGNTGILGINSVTGGTPIYSYSVNGIATTSVIMNLSVGPKTITVADLNGCVYTTTVNIPIFSGPTAASIISSSTTCNNANGSATVTSILGGTPNYQYSFDNGLFSVNNIENNMQAGPHSVVIKDANSCTLSINFIINSISVPNSVIATLTNVSCFNGSNGGFNLITSMGTPAYNYTLIPGNFTNTTGVFNNLTAQEYTVNISDASNCILTLTVAINQPSKLDFITLPIQSSCSGANYTITINASGGTTPYFYSINAGPNQTANTFVSNIIIGTNSITITDKLGCSLSQTLNVTQTPTITLTLNSLPANCTSATGLASVSVDGGQPVYSYSWVPTGATTSQINGIVAGNYTVTVKDNNNCSASGSVSVSSIPGGTAAIVNTASPTCNGTINGSLTANMLGNVMMPLTYLWSNGSTSKTLGSLVPGNYSVKIVDFYGCSDSVYTTVEANPEINIYIPNTYTPDDNGRNDVFIPFGYGISEESYKMEIFDRWGKLIFTSTEFQKGWDGKMKGSDIIVQNGIYVYKIMTTDIKNCKKNHVGYVTLMK